MSACLDVDVNQDPRRHCFHVTWGKIKCGRVSCSWNVPRLSPSADTSLAAIDLRRSDAQSQSSLHHETHDPVEKVCRSWLKETYTPIFGLKVQASSKHNIAAA